MDAPAVPPRLAALGDPLSPQLPNLVPTPLSATGKGWGKGNSGSPLLTGGEPGHVY
jgi:hypothetical protein